MSYRLIYGCCLLAAMSAVSSSHVQAAEPAPEALLFRAPPTPTLDRLATLGGKLQSLIDFPPHCPPIDTPKVSPYRRDIHLDGPILSPTQLRQEFSPRSCRKLVGIDECLLGSFTQSASPKLVCITASPCKPSRADESGVDIEVAGNLAVARHWGGCLAGLLLPRREIQAGEHVLVVHDAPLVGRGAKWLLVEAQTELIMQELRDNWGLLAVDLGRRKHPGWIEVKHPAALPRDEGRHLVERATSWLQSGEYDKAIADCTKAIQINPKNALAYSNRGAAWRMKAEYDKAIADLDRAIGIDSRSADALANRGDVWRLKGEYDKATADLDKAIAIDPQFALALGIRGQVWRLKGELDKAIADLTRAMDLNPQFVWACERLAWAWLEKGEQARAIAVCDDLIRALPKSAEAYAVRGKVWLMKGEYDKAINDLDKAIAIDPQSAFALANRGEAWRLKGEYDKALADLDKAIAIDPKSALSLALRGQVWRLKGEYDKAMTDLDKAIAIDPQSAIALANRGGAWLMKGEYDKAMTDLDRAIEIDPQSAVALAIRGHVWLMKAEYDKALADLDKAIAIDPQSAFALAHRGQVWNLKFEYDKAMADLDRALGIDPQSAFALAVRGQMWIMKGANLEAIQDLNQAIEIDAEYAYAFGARAVARASIRAFCEAIADCEKAKALAPNQMSVFYFRGAVWEIKADYDKAIVDFTKAIELDPHWVCTYHHLARVYLVQGDHRSAIGVTERLLAFAPDSPQSYLIHGDILSSSGRKHQAIGAYERGLRIDSDSVHAFTGLATIWLASGELDNAISSFNQAVALRPQYSNTYANRAAGWNAKGQYKKAIIDCTRALELNPHAASAYNNRATAWANLGQMDRALADYDAAIRLAPQLAAAYANRGHVRYALEQYDAALADYEQALQRSPDLSDALFGRAAVRLAKEDWDAAIPDLDRAIEIDPQSAFALANRGEVWRLKGEYDKAIEDLERAAEAEGAVAPSGRLDVKRLFAIGQVPLCDGTYLARLLEEALDDSEWLTLFIGRETAKGPALVFVSEYDASPLFTSQSGSSLEWYGVVRTAAQREAILKLLLSRASGVVIIESPATPKGGKHEASSISLLLHSPRSHRLRLQPETDVVLSARTQRHLMLTRESDYPAEQHVLLVAEPHYCHEGQLNVLHGLESLFEDNPHLLEPGTTVFLAEGATVGQTLPVDDLVALEPRPGPRLLTRMLATYTIPGYMAYQWKHQHPIPIIGCEDPVLYRFCARRHLEIWEGLERSGDRSTNPYAAIDQLTGWSVVARNRMMARTLLEQLESFPCPVLFVGNGHVGPTGARSRLSLDESYLVGDLNPDERAALRDADLRAIADYLAEENVGFYLLVPRGSGWNAYAPGYDQTFVRLQQRRYFEVFRQQLRGLTIVTNESQGLRSGDARDVTVAPWPEKAAVILAGFQGLDGIFAVFGASILDEREADKDVERQVSRILMFLGGLKDVLFGGVTLAVGLIGAVAPEPISTAVGILVAYHGGSTIGAGINKMIDAFRDSPGPDVGIFQGLGMLAFESNPLGGQVGQLVDYGLDLAGSILSNQSKALNALDLGRGLGRINDAVSAISDAESIVSYGLDAIGHLESALTPLLGD